MALSGELCRKKISLIPKLKHRIGEVLLAPLAYFETKLNSSINYTNPENGSNSVWTNANATKHMGEYISRIGGETASSGVRSQIMLKSYNASLNKAMLEISSKVPGRYFGTFGNWELGINTDTGVVYHARMIKW